VEPLAEQRITARERRVPRRPSRRAMAVDAATANGSPGDADVTDELLEAAPTFGNMLRTVGVSVANAQRALDESVVETVKKMAGTYVQVATEVVQYLNDLGLPDASKTEVVTHDVSLLSLATPPLHEWKSVVVTMDLDVSEIDARAGITFKQTGGNLSLQFGGGFSGSGAVAFDSTSIDSRFRSDFARGRLTLDGTLAPRTTTKFPDPVKIVKSPMISVSVGALVTDKTAGTRTVSLGITVLKDNGAVAPGKLLEIAAPGLLAGFDSNGSTTDLKGQAKAILTRNIGTADPAPPPQQFTMTLTMKQVRRVMQIAL
jgi:hypothetical protein